MAQQTAGEKDRANQGVPLSHVVWQGSHLWATDA